MVKNINKVNISLFFVLELFIVFHLEKKKKEEITK